jgi:hypothetical protein
MENIIVSVDEIAGGACETEVERLKPEERAIRDQITNFRASDRLPRHEVYQRLSGAR